MDKKQQPKAGRKKSGQGGGRIFRSIVIVFLALVLVGGVSVFFMLSTIVGSVDTDDLADKIVNREPSTIYAADGTKIYADSPINDRCLSGNRGFPLFLP